MRKSLKTILIFLGIPAIIIAGILSPNVPWNEVAHALIPPKFKVVILPTTLQNALLFSEDGQQIRSVGPSVIIPRDTLVIHAERVEKDNICIYTADIHNSSVKIAEKSCIPLKEPISPEGYNMRVVATYYRQVEIPYTFINSDTGIASWITIDKGSDHYFYLAKLTSESWSAGMTQSWEETMPNHLRLYPAGYNVIHTYSLNTHTYPYDPHMAYIARAMNGEKKRVDIIAKSKIEVIEVYSDYSTTKNYHLLILPIETVSARSHQIYSLPKSTFWHTYSNCSIQHPIKGNSWTTQHVIDVDISLSLNIGFVSVSLSGKSGIYAPSKWATKPPILWITGTSSEEFRGTVHTYSSIPSGAYLFVRR